MKRYLRWIILAALIALVAGGIGLTLHLTAEYPALGEAVSYPVNQAEGVTLTIEKPTWSPFKGYTLRWRVTAESTDVYTFSQDGEQAPDFAYLERYLEGQWYRLAYAQEVFAFNSMEFTLGGSEASSLQGSLVQKYCYYGTRLEEGDYRLVLEMHDRDGTPYYLAAEFSI